MDICRCEVGLSIILLLFFQAEKMFQEVRRLEPNKLEGNVAVV